MPEWTTSGFPPFLNHTWSRSTATRGLVLSPSWPESPQDPVLQPDVRQVLWGGRQGASPGAAARRSPMGGDRTCASRARSEHPVHIPAPTRNADRERAKGRIPLASAGTGPGPRPPRPGPAPAPRPRPPDAGPPAERAPPGGAGGRR